MLPKSELPVGESFCEFHKEKQLIILSRCRTLPAQVHTDKMFLLGTITTIFAAVLLCSAMTFPPAVNVPYNPGNIDILKDSEAYKLCVEASSDPEVVSKWQIQ